jgi:hypothetical protein
VIDPRELHECGRCSVRDRTVRSTIANLDREARIDGRILEGPRYAVEYRCAPCRELVRATKERHA